ncbi:hypothetical protein [Rhodalgimonas zhirmunskyi]|uniref:Argininosuccinate lyase n=1 Tax=Rhodalgimonas zhirmunskyi TaxID=2964767 RepID=A0AAJ1UF03_9RHOB|nr:hypothetical protein [Rhodoalgimonas zhirmunskyi]MDQ2094727.1 hypothetical protein [Rhodoalgimonas zhirmunskyi]
MKKLLLLPLLAALAACGADGDPIPPGQETSGLRAAPQEANTVLASRAAIGPVGA